MRNLTWIVAEVAAFVAIIQPLMALDPQLKITDFVRRSWTGDDVPFAAVNNLAQTPDGALWLSTPGGLYRFDGVRFTRADKLPRTSIRNMIVSLDGYLWIVFESGRVARMKGRDVTMFPLDELPQTNALAEDRDGSIIAATGGGGLYRFRNEHWRDAAKALHQTAKRSFFVWFDREGVLWLLTDDRLLKLLPGNDHFTDPHISAKTPSRLHQLFAQSKEGTVWFAEAGMIHAVKPDTGTTVNVREAPVLIDRQDSLWMGSYREGLFRIARPSAAAGKILSSSSPEVEHFGKKDGLSGNRVIALLEDREGNLWVGTEAGLDRLREGVFHHVPIPDAEDISSMWKSSHDGVLLRVNQKPYLQRVEPDGHVTSSNLRALPGQSCRDQTGRFWTSTSTGLGYIKGGAIIYPPQPSLNAVWTVECEYDDVWAVDLKQGIVRFVAGNVTKISTLRPQARLLYAEAPGRVWASYSDNRISLYDKGAVREFGPKDGLPDGITHDFVKDERGHLWLANEAGLARFRNGRFENVDVAPGVELNRVYLAKGSPFLWLAADKILMRIAVQEFDRAIESPGYRPTLETYGRLDGIPGSILMSLRSGNRLWLKASGGFGYLDIDLKPSKNMQPPPVRIETVTADGKTLDAAQGIALPKLIHDLQIDYTAFSLAIPERVRFRYKLEGVDQDWRDVGGARRAYYTDVAPGEHRFVVKAANNDGVWNEQGAALDFSIAPAYYQTFWFRAAVVAVFLTGILGFYLYRLRQVAHEYNVRLEERVRERTRIARELHDTMLQSFQALILRLGVVQLLIAEGRAKDELEQSLELARHAVEEGRSAVSDLRSQAKGKNDLAAGLQAIGEEFGSQGAAFRLLIEGRQRELALDVEEELCRITKEGLRNAFQHSQAKQIDVEIVWTERWLRVRIRDNGKGIPSEVVGHGRPGHFGLPGMSERAERIGAKVAICSSVEKGTEIEVSVAGAIAYCRTDGRRGFGFRVRGI